LVTIIKKTTELRTYINQKKGIGFVPTMGNLHEGHLELIKKSIEQNNLTVVSIFVNPTQFGVNEDLSSYPRTLKEDIKKIEKLEKKEIVIFCPESDKEIYPTKPNVNFSLPKLESKLCGKNRPGHFNGVMQVIYRLFNIVTPTNAYFGKKDYQQLLIIREFSKELFPNIKIHDVQIVREPSGLAMSSRNNYLTKEQKKSALILKNTLDEIASSITVSKDKNLEHVNSLIKNKTTNDSNWQYLELLDANNLSTPKEETTKLLIAGAYKIENVRLIDNQTCNI